MRLCVPYCVPTKGVRHMGMYTETFLRLHLKRDSPKELVDWFDNLANGPDDGPEWKPYDNHDFFQDARWDHLFCSGGAVYQISRRVQFVRSTTSFEDHELIIHASTKSGCEYEALLAWVEPWLAHQHGDFLGYTLYEDSRPSGMYGDDGPNQDRPHLIFMASRTEVVDRQLGDAAITAN